MNHQEPMETEEPPWEWIKWDEEIQYDIPDDERLLLPPSTRVQGRYTDWRPILSEENWLSDLRGQTLQEVTAKATHIQMDEMFSSFKEFDRCLDSWGVLNGRANYRVKTRKKTCLQTCRYGPNVRPPWRTPSTQPPPAESAVHEEAGESTKELDVHGRDENALPVCQVGHYCFLYH